MQSFWLISGILVALMWLDRLRDAAHGREIEDISTPEWDRSDTAPPKLSIIVPARDEGANIEPALRSMLALDYPDFEVIAVDDRSSDETGRVMDRIAEETIPQFRNSAVPQSILRVIHISDLPPGWLGKPHAMWLAAQQATGDWLLFTDGDVQFRADALRRAISYAEARSIDHLMVFPTHDLRSVGERMMVAAFNILFLFGHRPWKVHDPKARDFLGFGMFNLIRRRAYEALGTFKALRMEVIEDMKLGKLVKDHGFRQQVVYGPGLVRLRWFQGTLGCVRALRKNMFASMNYSWLKASGFAFCIFIAMIFPFLGAVLAPGWARAGFVVALLAIIAAYIGQSRRSSISPIYFCLHPISSALLIWAMFLSMAHVIRHGGVVWRGTRYSLDELRKGLVKS